MLLTIRTTKPLDEKQEELALARWEDILFQSAGVAAPGGPAYALEIGRIITNKAAPGGRADLTGITAKIERDPLKISAKVVALLGRCLQDGDRGHVNIQWLGRNGAHTDTTEIDFVIAIDPNARELNPIQITGSSLETVGVTLAQIRDEVIKVIDEVLKP